MAEEKGAGIPWEQAVHVPCSQHAAPLATKVL